MCCESVKRLQVEPINFTAAIYYSSLKRTNQLSATLCPVPRAPSRAAETSPTEAAAAAAASPSEPHKRASIHSHILSLRCEEACLTLCTQASLEEVTHPASSLPPLCFPLDASPVLSVLPPSFLVSYQSLFSPENKQGS